MSDTEGRSKTEDFVDGIGRGDLLRFCPLALAPVLLQSAPIFSFEERRIATQSEKYEINLRYPHLRYPELPVAARSFNAAVERIVQKRLAYYRAK